MPRRETPRFLRISDAFCSLVSAPSSPLAARTKNSAQAKTGAYAALPSNKLTGPPSSPFDRRTLKIPAASLRAAFLGWRPAGQARAILAVIGIALLGYLLFGDNPWDV